MEKKTDYIVKSSTGKEFLIEKDENHGKEQTERLAKLKDLIDYSKKDK